MGKSSELTESERGQIIGLHKGGHSQRNISKIIDIPRSTIGDTIRRYKNKGITKSAPRSGRPKKINGENKQLLKELAKENNHNSAEQLQKKFKEVTNVQVSTKTLTKELHQIGIFSCIAAKKPLITETQRINRLNWCLEKRHWGVSKWKEIIWSDESRFEIFKSDGPCRVWRALGERFNIENLSPTVKHGGGGVMMWGCFSAKSLGPLVKVEGTLNRFGYIEILEKNLLPWVKSNFRGENYFFQDDNAPIHTAKDVKAWIQKKRLKILPNWPSQSPDLNPIEHLWDELDRKVRKRPQHPRNALELEIALQEEWAKIPSTFYKKLVESMPNRIEECIYRNGWPTSY